jgi:hypothetical protein
MLLIINKAVEGLGLNKSEVIMEHQTHLTFSFSERQENS